MKAWPAAPAAFVVPGLAKRLVERLMEPGSAIIKL
jgi:hypothetical protein